MITMAVARERVAESARRLDAHDPQWPSKIDVGTLDLSGCKRCICGQLGWGGEHARSLLQGYRTGVEAGIMSYSNSSKERAIEYGLLQDAWIEAIAERLHPVVEVPIEAPVYVLVEVKREMVKA